jgi:phosphatidylserine synthase
MSIIRQMREVCQQRKPNARGKMVLAGHWFNTLFVRHFSIYITWFFIKTGVSANVVTFLIIPASLVGTALCVPHILWMNILGALLVILAEVFDCVDGEIARWTKKSSLKGVYLDLVSHVWCNAPLSMICGLHLYILNGRVRYLILAFLAYAMAQCSLGLGEIYNRVISQIPSDANGTAQSGPSSGKDLVKRSGAKQIAVRIVKRMILVFTDISVIRLTSFTCIFLSYAGIIGPLIFFAWFFVIFGIIRNVGVVASKFFLRIPHLRHIKKV